MQQQIELRRCEVHLLAFADDAPCGRIDRHDPRFPDTRRPASFPGAEHQPPSVRAPVRRPAFPADVGQPDLIGHRSRNRTKKNVVRRAAGAVIDDGHFRTVRVVGDPSAVGRPEWREVLMIPSDERPHRGGGARVRIDIDDAGVQIQRPVGQSPVSVGHGDLSTVRTPRWEFRVRDNPSDLAARGGDDADLMAPRAARPIEVPVGNRRCEIVACFFHDRASCASDEIDLVDVQIPFRCRWQRFCGHITLASQAVYLGFDHNFSVSSVEFDADSPEIPEQSAGGKVEFLLIGCGAWVRVFVALLGRRHGLVCEGSNPL